MVQANIELMKTHKTCPLIALVVITLQKRHNTRIFPEDKNPGSIVGGQNHNVRRAPSRALLPTTPPP